MKNVWVIGGAVAVGGALLYLLHKKNEATAALQAQQQQAMLSSFAPVPQTPASAPVAAPPKPPQATMVPKTTMTVQELLENPLNIKPPNLVTKKVISFVPLKAQIPASIPGPNLNSPGTGAKFPFSRRRR